MTIKTKKGCVRQNCLRDPGSGGNWDALRGPFESDDLGGPLHFNTHTRPSDSIKFKSQDVVACAAGTFLGFALSGISNGNHAFPAAKRQRQPLIEVDVIKIGELSRNPGGGDGLEGLAV